ncbi:MAG: hypothetical protein R3C49_00335 [Planctomycetaceae bacterium]
MTAKRTRMICRQPSMRCAVVLLLSAGCIGGPMYAPMGQMPYGYPMGGYAPAPVQPQPSAPIGFGPGYPIAGQPIGSNPLTDGPRCSCYPPNGYPVPGSVPNGYPITGDVPPGDPVTVNVPVGNPSVPIIPPQPNPQSPFVPVSDPQPQPDPFPTTPANPPPDNPPVVAGSPTGPQPATPDPVTPQTPDPQAPEPSDQPVVAGPPQMPETPTTPVPAPTTPTGDPNWVAWPLPPKSTSRQSSQTQGQTQTLISSSQDVTGSSDRGGHHHGHRRGRPMRSTVRGGSHAAVSQHAEAGLPTAEPSFGDRITGFTSSPAEDLKYRGGRTIPHLHFVNLYVGGDDAWSKNDILQIDRAIAAAMSDRNLNNVMMQYFQNQPITSTAHVSHPLVGYRPSKMSQGDVEYCLAYLYDNGFLTDFDLSSTVFNFLLPSGTVLTDDSSRMGTMSATERSASWRSRRDSTSPVSMSTRQDVAAESEDRSEPVGIPEAEQSTSLGGLGGYHGSIRKNGIPVYYSVDVYSEVRNGQANGIPVFSEPWKNVVATLYHELNEARTDPDVEDVIRNPYAPNADRLLGWTSDRGEECGDYPIDAARELSTIVREVPLTDGSGMVPVQFQYSNAVHGPEGPIAQPHPL